MSKLAVAIIADDLTGALDAGASFSMSGMRSVAALSPSFLLAAIAHAPQVPALNLGTRELSPTEAGLRAAEAVRLLHPLTGPETIWLKKIDSRLQGSVAAETAAVARTLGSGRIVLCPAIPELGRVVRSGRIEGHGVAQPIPVEVSLPDGVQVIAPDAMTDADLDRIVSAEARSCLFVGARGLAGAPARSLHPDRRTAPAVPGPIGFAIGSRDPVTRDQVAKLRASGGPRWIAAPDGCVPRPDGPGPFIVQATRGVAAPGDVVSRRLVQGMLAYLSGLGSLLARAVKRPPRCCMPPASAFCWCKERSCQVFPFVMCLTLRVFRPSSPNPAGLVRPIPCCGFGRPRAAKKDAHAPDRFDPARSA